MILSTKDREELFDDALFSVEPLSYLRHLRGNLSSMFANEIDLTVEDFEQFKARVEESKASIDSYCNKTKARMDALLTKVEAKFKEAGYDIGNKA